MMVNKKQYYIDFKADFMNLTIIMLLKIGAVQDEIKVKQALVNRTRKESQAS